MSTTSVATDSKASEPTHKIALVTGANRSNGVGFATVQQLATKDKNITVIFTSRDKASGEKALKLHHDAGLKNVEMAVLDVTDDKSVKACVDGILAKHKRIDILINNAGLSSYGQFMMKASQMDMAELERMMQVNCYGPIRLAAAVVPSMVANNYGRIVNVSTILSLNAFNFGGFPSYRTSKIAQNSFTRSLSVETQGSNIFVNAMCPGFSDTDFVPKELTEAGGIKKRPPAKGAETAVWLATLPSSEKDKRGNFYQDQQKFDM